MGSPGRRVARLGGALALTTIVWYVSGHGLGHASRTIAAVDALGARRRDLRLVARTPVGRWLFDLAARVPLDVQSCQTDVGMVQIDSLQIDVTASADRAASFYATFDERVASEAAWLKAERAALVLGDVPPLAFAAAARADVPSIVIGNFTWDWIYEEYPAFESRAPGVIRRIGDAYRAATRALRLPFHGGFAPLADRVRDIPLVVRRSTRDPRDTRLALGLGDDRPLVLASFGAYGAPLPYAEALRDRRLTVLTTQRDAVAAPGRVPRGLVPLNLAALYDRGIRYEDIVAAADVVLSKPGYGVVSECAAHGTALLYTTRGRFREQGVFIAEMPRVVRARRLERRDLLEGRWTDAVERLLAQPDPPERARVDGADVAAGEILGELRN